ncbi:MAG: GNAT family N-acetyltransferase [Gammaproteobacteria bacterium]|nr:GNAT family N-acetyltransferase [Gammaproteobacteria bacterium]
MPSGPKRPIETHFRHAKRSDVATIAAMSRDLVEFGLSWSWRDGRIERCLRDHDTMVLIAQRDRQIAGFAIMEFADEDAHLNLIAVKPRFQRQDVGKDMLAWLERSARTAGISTIYLELRSRNRSAWNFYRNLGYREIAHLPGYYEGLESGLRMMKDLSWTEDTSEQDRLHTDK